MAGAGWRRLRTIVLGILYVLGLVGSAWATLPATADAASSSAPAASATVSTTSPYASAAGVTWTFGFTATTGVGAGQRITVGSPGATFSGVGADFTLEVNGAPAAASVSPGGPANPGEAAITPTGAIPPGAAVSIQALNTVNPPVAAGSTQVGTTASIAVEGYTAVVNLTFKSPATGAATTGSNVGSGRLALGGHPLPPLPAAELPASNSTSGSFQPFTMQADIRGPNLAGSTPDYAQTLDTSVATFPAQHEKVQTIGSTTYYVVNAAAVEIPVQCHSNPGWLVACNVQVEDAGGNPWPDVRVIDASGGTVTAPTNSFWETPAGTPQTMQQVAINTPEQAARTPAVSPQTFVAGYASTFQGPVTAPAGLTLVPLGECTAGAGAGSGGQASVGATLLIPLNAPSAAVKVVETVVATSLNNAETAGHSLAPAPPYQGFSFPFDNGSTAADACGWQAGIAAIELSTPVSEWNGALNSDTFVAPQQLLAGTGVNTEYTDIRTIDLAQLPAAEVQLPVMPYKILYQPPGDNGHSQFDLTQTQTSQTNFEISRESTHTTATGNEVGWSAGLNADGFDVSYTGSWDQTTTQATANKSGNENSEAWTSEVGQQWQSYSSANNNGLPQLDTPGAQPWLYDEFVLKVHPQFAIYDDVWCPDGTTDCGTKVNSNGTATSLPTSPGQGSTTSWTLLGARPVEFDVRAGALLACAQGHALPIPATGETLSSAECGELLNLDPFAAAATQSLDPTSSAPGAIGALASFVQQFSAGEPGTNLGTNGSYTLQLSQSQATVQATSTTSTFSSSIDSTISNGVQTGVSFPIVEGLGASATAQYQSTVSNGNSMAITYAQSQTQDAVTQSSAKAMLSDLYNPITTTIYLDTRWDTLMFQVPQPTVTGVDPAYGLAGGGAVLHVTGTGFYSGPVGVEFCPGASGTGGACIPATSVTVGTAHTLRATAPALQPGTYCLQVIDAGGPSTCGIQSEYAALTVAQFATQNGVTAPIVSSVTPASGPNGGGSTVTIGGANLTGVQQVWFGSNDPSTNPGLYQQFEATAGPGSLPTLAQAPFVTLNDGEIMACAPPVAAPESVWVSVYSQTGWSVVTSADKFSYTAGAGSVCNPATNSGGPAPAPTVTGISPPSGPVIGGTMVTVSGSGFAEVPQAVACSLAACPPGSTTTLLLPPPVQFCAPGEAVCSPATNVQLGDANTLRVQVPPSETGTGAVDVEVYGAGGWSAQSPEDQYTYEPLPLRPLEPNGSLALGATPPQAAAALGRSALTATLLDSNDQPVAGAPVFFSTTLGQLSVTGAVYTDGGGVAHDWLTSPAPGRASVAAEVYGNPNLLDRTQVVFDPVPIVTGLSTDTGPAAGGTSVTIQGQGFSGATQVDFGTAPATSFTVSGDGSSIAAVSPPGLGTVDVRVANPAAESGPVAADAFTYTFSTGGSGHQPLTAPVVASVSPSFGPQSGGTTVTVGGSGFGGATAVYFGNTPAESFTVSPDGNSLTAVSPPGSSTVDVSVENSAGRSGTVPADRFSYLPPPAVTSVGPASGPLAGGTTVTIGGTGLGAVTGVAFGGASVPAADITHVSDDELDVVAPAGTSAAQVAVTVSAACAAGTTGATACGTSLADPAAAFTYLPLPAVTGVSPAAGPVAGGQAVTITGTGLTTVINVFFGGAPAESFTLGSDGQISAVAPAATRAGAVDVTVTTRCATASTADATSCGTSPTSGADLFTYGLPAPVVGSVTPDHGSAAGGAAVTILGSGFTPGATVRFGDVGASNPTVVSGSKITVSAPAGPAAGGVVDVTVTTPCGAAATGSCGTSATTAADRFTYYPSSAQVVTRTLQPGWNTLSIPFPLAQGDRTLVQILGGTRPLAAFAFTQGRWRLLNPDDPEAVAQAMQGLYVYIGGSSPVTATLVPAAGTVGSASAPSSPGAPPTFQLESGWNLVGPSAALGSQSYSQFLTGVEPSSVTMLIDPNGADVAVSQPAADTGDMVQNGYAYWVYEVQGGQTLVGQILTGSGPGGSHGGGSGH